MGFFKSTPLKPAPKFCEKCGAPLELREFNTATGFNPATGQPNVEMHLLLACVQIPATSRGIFDEKHTSWMEGNLKMEGYAAPAEMSAWYDRKWNRKPGKS